MQKDKINIIIKLTIWFCLLLSCGNKNPNITYRYYEKVDIFSLTFSNELNQENKDNYIVSYNSSNNKLDSFSIYENNFLINTFVIDSTEFEKFYTSDINYYDYKVIPKQHKIIFLPRGNYLNYYIFEKDLRNKNKLISLTEYGIIRNDEIRAYYKNFPLNFKDSDAKVDMDSIIMKVVNFNEEYSNLIYSVRLNFIDNPATEIYTKDNINKQRILPSNIKNIYEYLIFTNKLK